MAGSEVWITLPRRKPFKNIFQFKISLRGTKPPVWRRIQVAESYSLYDLHVAIQDAMGWLDYHLHMFEFKDKGNFGRDIRIDCPFVDPDFEEEEPVLTTEVPIKTFFKKAGDSALYTYDFGDGWQHDVVLEGILLKESGKAYPVCLGGELACPPEDCGGVPGYYECITAVRNKDNSEGLLTWLGRWRPDRFDPKKVTFENPRSRLRTGMEG